MDEKCLFLQYLFIACCVPKCLVLEFICQICRIFNMFQEEIFTDRLCKRLQVRKFFF